MADTGKNKRRQLEVEDTLHGKTLLVDSVEEVDMVNWACEAAELSVIYDFEYQPSSFKLFEQVKYKDVSNKDRCLFRDHVYTPDFIISFNPSTHLALAKELKIQYSDVSSDVVSSYIDVKGTFAMHDGGRSFSLNQKWVWSLFGKYIYKLVPKNFFKLFGCPLKSFYSGKTKKPRKIFRGFKSIRNIFS